MALFQNLFGPPQPPGMQPAAPALPRVPWSQNPAITTAALSLLGGRNLNEGLANVAATAGQGMAAKSNLQGFMLKRQEEDAAKAAQRAAWNAGMKWKSSGGDWNTLAPEDQAALSAMPDIAAQFMPQPPKLPTSVQEYQYGQKDPAFNDWQMNKQKAGATTVNVGGEGGADTKLRSKLSEAEGTRWSTIQQTGQDAAARSQDLQVMGELMKIAPQGPVTGKLAEMFPGFSSAGDAMNALVKRIAPTMRSPGSGATSDVEYDGMLKSIPSLSKDPLGNQIILETMQAKQQLDMARADIVTAYQNEEISASEARAQMAELNRRSILTPKARMLITAAAGGEQPEDIPPIPPSYEGDPADWEYLTPEQRALFD